VIQPELTLQPFAGLFHLGDQIVAVAVVALAEIDKIRRQIDLEYDRAQGAQSRRRPIQLRIPAGPIGEQEDHRLDSAIGQDQR
jgi:hypothetical protein